MYPDKHTTFAVITLRGTEIPIGGLFYIQLSYDICILIFLIWKCIFVKLCFELFHQLCHLHLSSEGYPFLVK